jgi:hypothetical protein
MAATPGDPVPQRHTLKASKRGPTTHSGRLTFVDLLIALAVGMGVFSILLLLGEKYL